MLLSLSEDTSASSWTPFPSLSPVLSASSRSVILTCWTAAAPSTARCVSVASSHLISHVPYVNNVQFNTMVDKKKQRKVLGLKVRCSRKKDGCEWKGELRHLDHHEREECVWALVECRYHCGERVPRRQLAEHEQDVCSQRPVDVKLESFMRKMEERHSREIATAREDHMKEMATLREDHMREIAVVKEELEKEKESHKDELFAVIEESKKERVSHKGNGTCCWEEVNLMTV